MYRVDVKDSVVPAGCRVFCAVVSGKPTCFACCGSLILSRKSEGEQKERGSCNSAYSCSFQHSKRCVDIVGLAVMRLSSLVVLIINDLVRRGLSHFAGLRVTSANEQILQQPAEG